jgi:hypothetical protein
VSEESNGATNGVTNAHPKREKAVGLFLDRLDRFVSSRADAESRLYERDVNKLLIHRDDIPDSYWTQQEQIARDNGRGTIVLSEYVKSTMARKIVEQQRESLEEWATYMQDAPYPMWFKFYAWDGMSKMGVFDNGLGQYRKRDKTTVAPYPALNPAVLARTYEAVQNIHADTEANGDELQKLVRGGNFNKIYSYLLLNQKAVLATPERPEDVRGDWIRYTEHDVDALAAAAEGTPWCIAGKSMAASYTTGGGEFFLFHLEDPKTGKLSATAAAAIRMSEGEVAEISGLKGGKNQFLEDSLVPTVREKVQSLPGGEKYLIAFEDKQRLIAIDRKMQTQEELSTSDLIFLYEIDRPVEYIDTYQHDPRRKEFLADRTLSDDMEQIFGKLPPDILLKKIMAHVAYETILEHSEEVVGFTHDQVVFEVIKSGGIETVVDCIDKMPPLSMSNYALLLRSGFREVLTALNYLDVSKQLQLAEVAIMSGCSHAIIPYVQNFDPRQQNHLMKQMILNGEANQVIYFHKNFSGYDPVEIGALTLKQPDMRKGVVRSSDGHEVMKSQYNDRGDYKGPVGVSSSLDHFYDFGFNDLYRDEILRRLFDEQKGNVSPDRLNKFNGITDPVIIQNIFSVCRSNLVDVMKYIDPDALTDRQQKILSQEWI